MIVAIMFNIIALGAIIVLDNVHSDRREPTKTEVDSGK